MPGRPRPATTDAHARLLATVQEVIREGGYPRDEELARRLPDIPARSIRWLYRDLLHAGLVERRTRDRSDEVRQAAFALIESGRYPTVTALKAALPHRSDGAIRWALSVMRKTGAFDPYREQLEAFRKAERSAWYAGKKRKPVTKASFAPVPYVSKAEIMDARAEIDRDVYKRPRVEEADPVNAEGAMSEVDQEVDERRAAILARPVARPLRLHRSEPWSCPKVRELAERNRLEFVRSVERMTG